MSKIDKFVSLLKDDNNIEEIMKKRDPREVKDYLNEMGIDYSLEEVKMLGKNISALIASRRGELSEKELEIVSGGVGEIQGDPIIRDVDISVIDKFTNKVSDMYNDTIEWFKSW